MSELCARCLHPQEAHSVRTNYWCSCGDCPEYLTEEQVAEHQRINTTVPLADPHHHMPDDPSNGYVGCSCAIGRDHTWTEFTADGVVMNLDQMVLADIKAIFARDAEASDEPTITL